jgi:hypothetical protein
MSETVNHPDFYNQGSIEVIDAIAEWKLNFALGNIVKYVARADHKGDALEDLQKALWYLNYEIERREAQEKP